MFKSKKIVIKCVAELHKYRILYEDVFTILVFRRKGDPFYRKALILPKKIMPTRSAAITT